MPLDTSTYSLALLRLDGRRWNELRHMTGQISTQSAAGADGSSYLSIGNTSVLCTVNGPAEIRNRNTTSTTTTNATTSGTDDEASVSVEISIAGFSGVDRKKRSGDRRVLEMQSTLSSAFQTHLFTDLFPRSTISITLHVLAQDGSLLATCVNAATLALIDAGIPMPEYLVACTAGVTLDGGGGGGGGGGGSDSRTGGEEDGDPLLDLNGQEELELPFLTVATVGNSDLVSVLVCESRCRVERVEGMLAVAVDGCKQVKEILDGIVRERGGKTLQGMGG